jgi:V/A-type H+-transporting ATPase subunit E
MANLEALLKREAQAEVDAIISEAKSRASEIVASAKEDASTLKAQRERSAQSQHEALIVRGKSAAQLEAASLKLRTQHELVEGAFDAAKGQLDALIKDKGRYQEVLPKLLDEVLESLSGAQVMSVIVNPSDKKLITDALKERGVALTVETDKNVHGGVRVKTETNVMVSNSLIARLESARDELAADASQALFAS